MLVSVLSETARMQTGGHKRPKVGSDANDEEERKEYAEAKRELRAVMVQYHIAQAHTAYIREELRKAEAAEAAADALRKQAEDRLLDLD